jgi:CubicO group peptidase (beta-lactamase class C family)
MRSAAITDFITSADQTIQHLHSFMLLRHGMVIAEGWRRPYRRSERHMLFSLSKSFTSTAVGMAVAEGRLNVHDPVLKYFSQDAPRKISPHLAAMQVRHLLAMSTGHDQDITDRTLRSRNPFKTFLAQRVDHAPGSHFVYNTAASFMLSAIVQKLTGQTLAEYLTARLFEPLGIREVSWESHPNGVNFGGFGLSLTTEEIARFGQLYLQRGEWQGRQLIPAEWVAEATRKHTDNGSNPASDWEQGYAYQFWRCRPSGVYRADGAFGQYCVIMPEQEAVLAITGGLDEMQAVLDLAWEKLLPGMQQGALTEGAPSQRALAQTFEDWAIDPPQGVVSALEAAHSGREFSFAANPLKLHALSLDFAANTLHLHLLGGGGRREVRSLPFGRSAWVEGQLQITASAHELPLPPKVVTSGCWRTKDTFELTICHYQTPFIVTLSLHFTGGQVRLKYDRNVSFGGQEFPELVSMG